MTKAINLILGISFVCSFHSANATTPEEARAHEKLRLQFATYLQSDLKVELGKISSYVDVKNLQMLLYERGIADSAYVTLFKSLLNKGLSTPAEEVPPKELEEWRTFYFTALRDVVQSTSATQIEFANTVTYFRVLQIFRNLRVEVSRLPSIITIAKRNDPERTDLFLKLNRLVAEPQASLPLLFKRPPKLLENTLMVYDYAAFGKNTMKLEAFVTYLAAMYDQTKRRSDPDVPSALLAERESIRYDLDKEVSETIQLHPAQTETPFRLAQRYRLPLTSVFSESNPDVKSQAMDYFHWVSTNREEFKEASLQPQVAAFLLKQFDALMTSDEQLEFLDLAFRTLLKQEDKKFLMTEFISKHWRQVGDYLYRKPQEAYDSDLTATRQFVLANMRSVNSDDESRVIDLFISEYPDLAPANQKAFKNFFSTAGKKRVTRWNRALSIPAFSDRWAFLNRKGYPSFATCLIMRYGLNRGHVSSFLHD